MNLLWGSSAVSNDLLPHSVRPPRDARLSHGTWQRVSACGVQHVAVRTERSDDEPEGDDHDDLRNEDDTDCGC